MDLGIDDGWWDVRGQWQQASPDALGAIRSAVGSPSGDVSPTWFVRAGSAHGLQSHADLVLEDGTALRDLTSLPHDLPLGYHALQPHDGGPTTRVVVTPGRCHLPHDLRVWGWAIQLYATRSTESWGIGDLADLRRVAEWSRSQGARIATVSPLHAVGPASPQQPSPYYPSSRRFRNPLHLRVEEVPGAPDADLDRLAALGRALNADRHIDRDAVWRIKRDALELAFARFKGDPALDDYLVDQGESLLQFATYCAIADEHGNGWSSWPDELQHPSSRAVREYAEAHAETVGFHAWLQWLLEEQLARASELPLVHDLAVGFDAGGADAWVWQDLLALDMRVGAPPDEFNEAGQDWGLPPFVPWKLRATGYRPIIETFRSAFRHAGGLRVDHVMGLFRLFWQSEHGGTYVRYPSSDLLDLLALESVRAGAIVVGEDLGTVEDAVRHELYERQVLSYRLLWFEDAAPEHWPQRALGAVTTHDLPTIAGVATGADPQSGAMRSKLGDGALGDVVVDAYERLAHGAPMVVVGTLDDALEVTERPNIPGTTVETNWSTALPSPLEEIETDERVARVTSALKTTR